MMTLRSFHETKASELRIRWTMQVWTMVSGKTAPIASGKPLRPSTTAIRISPTPRALQLVHHLEPELGALALLDPKAEDVLVALGIERQRDVDGLVVDQTLVADLHPQRIEEDDGIDAIERPVLPVADLLEHRIGDPADQIRRDLDAIELLQVALDLADRQAAGIERDDLAVEAVEPRLPLGHERGSKVPARSRGIDRSSSPSSLSTVLAEWPLRLLPLPRPAGSPFS